MLSLAKHTLSLHNIHASDTRKDRPVSKQLEHFMGQVFEFYLPQSRISDSLSLAISHRHTTDAPATPCIGTPSQRFQAPFGYYSSRGEANCICTGLHGGGLLILSCNFRFLQTGQRTRHYLG